MSLLKKHTTSNSIIQYIDTNASVILVAAMAGTFFMLLVRGMGLTCLSLPDDLVYVRMTRDLTASETQIPIYIYRMIFKLCHKLGEGFFDGAKLLNCLFYVCSAPFIYITALRVSSRPFAVLVSILSLFSASNYYAMCFMPETAYFFFFWIFASYFLRNKTAEEKFLPWIFSGSLLALLALIKINAIFLLPGLILCIVIFSRQLFSRWIVLSVQRIVLFLLSFFLSRLFFISLFVHIKKASLVGDFYSQYAASAGTENFFRQFLDNTPTIASGYAMALCSIFGLPLAILTVKIIPAIFKKIASPESRLFTFTFFIALNLIGLCVAFTISIKCTDSTGTTDRIFLRYCSFVFPLFLMLISSGLSSAEKLLPSRWVKFIALVPIALAIVLSICTRFSAFQILNHNDIPELFSWHRLSLPEVQTYIPFVLWGGGLLCLLLWLKSSRLGSWVFIGLVFPALLFVTQYDLFKMSLEARKYDVVDGHRRALQAVRWLLSPSECKKLLVVGDNYSYQPYISMYIPGKGPIIGYFQAGHSYTWKRPYIPGGITPVKPGSAEEHNRKVQVLQAGYNYLPETVAPPEWILLFGRDIKLADDAIPIFQMPLPGGWCGEATLIRTDVCANVYNFRDQFSWLGRIRHATGLGPAQPWGTMSLGDKVLFEFEQPLPAHFELQLTAATTAKNEEKVFTVSVGQYQQNFSLTKTQEIHTIAIDNVAKSNTMQFSISELTENNNSARLSEDFMDLAFAEFTIRDLEGGETPKP